VSLIQGLLRHGSRSKVEESVVELVSIDVVNSEMWGKLYAAAEEPHGSMRFDNPGARLDLPVALCGH
jgi:hypothetical protein